MEDELDDETKKQYDNIIKSEPEIKIYTFISFSNKKERKEDEI